MVGRHGIASLQDHAGLAAQLIAAILHRHDRELQVGDESDDPAALTGRQRLRQPARGLLAAGRLDDLMGDPRKDAPRAAQNVLIRRSRTSAASHDAYLTSLMSVWNMELTVDITWAAAE